MLTKREQMSILDDVDTVLASLVRMMDNPARDSPPGSSIALLRSIQGRLYDSMEGQMAKLLALPPASNE